MKDLLKVQTMSRIGKKPIPLPSGVKVQVGEQLEVTGPKGKLTVPIPEGIRSTRGTASWKSSAPAMSRRRCTG